MANNKKRSVLPATLFFSGVVTALALVKTLQARAAGEPYSTFIFVLVLMAGLFIFNLYRFIRNK